MKHIFCLFILLHFTTLLSANKLLKETIEFMSKATIDELQILVSKRNQCYYSAHPSSIKAVLQSLDSLEFKIPEYTSELNPSMNRTEKWEIEILNPGKKSRIFYITFEENYKELFVGKLVAKLDRTKFFEILENHLSYFHKVNYTCKSIMHYRTVVDNFLKIQSHRENILAFENYNSIFMKDADWGYCDITIQNIKYNTTKQVEDSITKLLQQKLLNANLKVIFNYISKKGELSARELSNQNRSAWLKEDPKATQKPTFNNSRLNTKEFIYRGRIEYFPQNKEVSTVVKKAELANLSIECSLETYEKIDLGINKTPWEILKLPELMLTIYTNNQTEMIRMLDGQQ